MLTRKHFRALAKILSETKLNADDHANLVHEIGMFCKSENYNFNWSLFEEACTQKTKKD